MVKYATKNNSITAATVNMAEKIVVLLVAIPLIRPIVIIDIL